MERPVFKPIGTPVEELDTPALVVDIALLKQNIDEVHSIFEDGPSRIRPDVHAHLCPAIASAQLGIPGTVDGIAVATAGEAEVFANSGIKNILIGNHLVTRGKITRVCGIARQSNILVVVENKSNAALLSEVASDADVSLGVLVRVRQVTGYMGVDSADAALTLTKEIVSMKGLEFKGLYLGGKDELQETDAESLNLLQESRDLLKASDIDVPIVSMTSNQAMLEHGGIEGVTEVIAGAYALMDNRHTEFHTNLRHAARILTTVITHPEPGVAWLDTGQKASSIDTGLPEVDGISGVNMARMSAEHGGLVMDGDAQNSLEIGDKVWLIPSDIGNSANVYDFIHVIQDGKLETVWNVAARGQYS